MKIKLGNARNPLNDIKINDPSVSYNHLEISLISDDQLAIKDLGSTNKTKVIKQNGKEREILESIVSRGDILIIGQNRRKVEELIIEVKSILNKDKVIWYEEFNALEALFMEFQKKKSKLTTMYSIRIQLLKYGIISLVLIAFILLGKRLGLPDTARYGIGIFGGFLSVFIIDRIFSRAKYEEKLRDLHEEYSKILVCPKCRRSMISRSYKAWKEMRICPVCQANWSK